VSAAAAAAGGDGGDAAPAWAQRLRAEQTSRHRRQLAVHMFGAGSSRGAGATPDIKERD
jgi:type IV secretion system protein TrbL